MTVMLFITYRDGRTETFSLPPFAAALLCQRPPDDVYSLRAVGGNVDDYLRSHVPFVPLTERPHVQAGREQAPCN